MQQKSKTILLRFAAASGAVLVLIVMLLFLAFRTGPGHSSLAWMINWLADGDVAITGLSGNLPNQLHADVVEIRDAQGTWLRVENVRLDWNAWAALGNHYDISRLEAARATVLRPPVPSGSTSPDPRVDVAAFTIARIDIAPAITGKAAILTARGSLHYTDIHNNAADITATQLDGAGTYRLNGAISRDVVTGMARISETDNGIAGGLLGFVTLGPMTFDAQAAGNETSNQINLRLNAGPLNASAQGTISLATRTANITLAAASPAMNLSPNLSWSALSVQGRFQGTFDRPFIQASLRLENLRNSGHEAGLIQAALNGDQGMADLTATISSLQLAGMAPSLFRATPVQITARTNLTLAAWPVSFELRHPLLQATGTSSLSGVRTTQAVIDAPSLQALAPLIGADLSGSAKFNLRMTESANTNAIVMDGIINARGNTPIARLLGGDARFNVNMSLADGNIASLRGALNAAAVTANISGAARNGAPDFRWDFALSDLSRLSPPLTGRLRLQGTLRGEQGNARLASTGEAFVGTGQFSPQRLAIAFDASGLPQLNSGQLRINGRFADASLSFLANLERSASGILSARIGSASWKGVTAEGRLVLPNGNQGLAGTIALHVRQLESIAPLIGVKAAGSLDGTIAFTSQGARTTSRVNVQGRAIMLDTVSAERLDISGTIDDALNNPLLNLTGNATGLRTAGYSGKADITLAGALENVTLGVSTDMTSPDSGPIQLTATGSGHLSQQTFTFTTATLVWQEKKLVLTAPASINFAAGLAIDRLRAELDGAPVEMSGRLLPRLAVDVTASGIKADMLRPFVTQNVLDGTFSLTAKLSGTLDAPQGTFELRGANLRPYNITERGFAATSLDARGSLTPTGLIFDATLSSGKNLQLSLKGTAGLTGAQALNMQTVGSADLSMLNAIYAATGQSLTGSVTLDATITGSLVQPRVVGNFKLSDGEFRDYSRGIRVQALSATATAQGNVIRISQVTGRAGNGTISGSGTIDLSAPSIPVDVTFTASNARPLVSDLLTASMDSSLKLQGSLKETLTLSGNVSVREGEIKIPGKLPPRVAILDVRRQGQAAPTQTGRENKIVLDLTITSQGRMFVRGRGIDADMGGSLKVEGTLSEPIVLGALTMRRGTLTIAERTLSFTSGKVGFDGFGLRNRLDPTLDFSAETSSAGITARLLITGYASAPRIQLSSTPTLPQDEVIARLLFQQGIKQLSALQLAEIAQAIAALSGLGSGFNPVGSIRQSLGLDRLSIGSTSDAESGQSRTTIDVGKYITPDVYVGATQDLSGRTRAIVEFDITKNLKATATVNTGTGTAPATGAAATDTGDSIGLTYQFDY